MYPARKIQSIAHMPNPGMAAFPQYSSCCVIDNPSLVCFKYMDTFYCMLESAIIVIRLFRSGMGSLSSNSPRR